MQLGGIYTYLSCREYIFDLEQKRQARRQVTSSEGALRFIREAAVYTDEGLGVLLVPQWGPGAKPGKFLTFLLSKTQE